MLCEVKGVDFMTVLHALTTDQNGGWDGTMQRFVSRKVGASEGRKFQDPFEFGHLTGLGLSGLWLENVWGLCVGFANEQVCRCADLYRRRRGGGKLGLLTQHANRLLSSDLCPVWLHSCAPIFTSLSIFTRLNS